MTWRLVRGGAPFGTQGARSLVTRRLAREPS